MHLNGLGSSLLFLPPANNSHATAAQNFHFCVNFTFVPCFPFPFHYAFNLATLHQLRAAGGAGAIGIGERVGEDRHLSGEVQEAPNVFREPAKVGKHSRDLLGEAAPVITM